MIYKDTVLLPISDKRKDETELENGQKLKNQNQWAKLYQRKWCFCQGHMMKPSNILSVLLYRNL